MMQVKDNMNLHLALNTRIYKHINNLLDAGISTVNDMQTLCSYWDITEFRASC